MTDKTPPSLRAQIIEAIEKFNILVDSDDSIAADMFDRAIMPVLQKAMDAGQLLVGRNTKDRIPVHTAVMRWLEQVVGHVRMIEQEEATISRRQLLKIISQFGETAQLAVNDAKRILPEIH